MVSNSPKQLPLENLSRFKSEKSKDENGKKKKKPANKKRKHIKIFKLEDGLFLYQTYFDNGLDSIPNQLGELKELVDPVAITTYKGKGSKRGVITSFLLNANLNLIIDIVKDAGYKIDQRDARNTEHTEEVDSQFNIHSKHLPLEERLKGNIVQAIREDIVEFCKIPAIKQLEISTHFQEVQTLDKLKIPIYVLKIPSPNQIVKSGKGTTHPICKIDIGIDTAKACLATIDADGNYNPRGKCSYCYATRYNGGNFLENLFDISQEEFLEILNAKIKELNLSRRKKIYLRFGQSVETCVPKVLRKIKGFENNLPTILDAIVEASKEREYVCAMPTKTIEYNKQLAEKLRKARVSVLSSIGYEALEQGMVRLGFDTKRRLQEILKLAKAGVNANLFVATDITRPMSEMQDEAKRAADFYQKHSEYLGLQFLDIRVTKKIDAEIISGMPWKQMLGQASLLEDNVSNRWQKGSQNYNVAKTTHPDFLGVIGKGNKGKIRLCSTHVKGNEIRCGECFMDRC